MASEGVNFVANAMSAVLGFADDLFSTTNAYNYIFGGIFVFSVYRFLLKPILGGEVGSDKVRKSKGKGNKEDE